MAPSELAALRALIEDSTKSLTALINYNRDELLAKFEEVKTELTAVKSVATAQSKEIFILKTKMNEFEQQDKARSLRIFGLRITKEDDEALGTNKAVVKRIYDRIVKPILTIAKSKNMIDSVPQLGNCLVEGYRVGPPPKSDSATPPLVVKFLTKEIRDVVLKLKRENTPPPPSREEKDAGVKRIIVVEDLTPATHNKLKELVAHADFEKVWTFNGAIRYTLTSDKEKYVRKLASPFTPVPEILLNQR